jgi:hypothetical protein
VTYLSIRARYGDGPPAMPHAIVGIGLFPDEAARERMLDRLAMAGAVGELWQVEAYDWDRDGCDLWAWSWDVDALLDQGPDLRANPARLLELSRDTTGEPCGWFDVDRDGVWVDSRTVAA